MAATQIGNVSACDVHERPRIGPEDVARFLAESGTGYKPPGAELGLQAFRSGRNAPKQQPRVVLVTQPKWVPSGESNAPSSGEAGSFDAYRCFRVPESRWLADALAALAEVDDEIAEENLPQVSDAANVEAARIIKALARCAPVPALAVYPTQDAEIALHFKSPGRPGTVVILLSDGGRADCHAYVGGRSRRSHYETSSDLPDAFVLDQLRRLTPDRTGASVPGVGVAPFPTTFLTNSLFP